MKRTITSLGLTLAFFTAAQAQPVISNGNNMLPVGFSDSVANVISATTSPGAAGANVTWDLSALTPTVVGVAKIVAPSATPYASIFPSATYAIELTPNGAPGSIYEYYVVSATKWDIIGNGYSVASPSGNYTPDPKLMIPFPFSFTQSVTDTYQKLAGSPGSVTVTYDGYGTLITPYKTVSNVIRVKRDFGGTDYFYDWFSVNPLVIAASYDNNTQKYTFLSTSSTTDVKDVARQAKSSVYPNPIVSTATISLSGTSVNTSAKVIVTDVTGRIVKTMKMENQKTTFSRDGLNSGLYFYTVYSQSAPLAAGKFVIE
jgi:hypothetical protein